MVNVRFQESSSEIELPPISQCANIYNLIASVDDKNLSDCSCIISYALSVPDSIMENLKLGKSCRTWSLIGACLYGVREIASLNVEKGDENDEIELYV